MLRHTQTPASPPPPRLYYGWHIVGACNLVACITWGVGICNQGVFLGYFASHYGWSRATLSIGPMLFHFWAGLAGVVVGRSIDRHSPRPVLLLGACLMGAGALAFGLTRHPWHTYPAFVLLSTGFACLHTVTLGKIVARWFVLQPLATASCFGQRVFGRIYGPIYLGIRLGAAFGPLFIGVISTALGRYQPVWLLLAVALLLAAASSHWAVPPRPRRAVCGQP